MTNTEKNARPVRVRSVPAVTRAISILRLLGTQRQGLGVKAIADELALVPSTALHILRVLVSENLVQIDLATKRYTLGSGMVSLARNVLEKSSFAAIAQPGLNRIAGAFAITILGVEMTRRQTALVLCAAKPDHPVQLHADVGSEFPWLTSASGRLVAAHSSLDQMSLRAMFETIAWDQTPGVERWLEEVQEAGRKGWAIDRDAYKNGVTAISAGVFAMNGQLTHTLVALGLTSALASTDLDALALAMQREAAIIGSHLSAGL